MRRLLVKVKALTLFENLQSGIKGIKARRLYKAGNVGKVSLKKGEHAGAGPCTKAWTTALSYAGRARLLHPCTHSSTNSLNGFHVSIRPGPQIERRMVSALEELIVYWRRQAVKQIIAQKC